MTDRGTSTTLDVVLFVLLVGTAVTVVVTAVPPPSHDAPWPGDAAVTAAGVTIRVDGSAHAANGTTANLLADAAVLAASGERPAVVAGVARAANRTLRNVSGRVQVVALYRPFDRVAPISRLDAGPVPPGDTPVDAVSITVPLERNVSADALATAADEGYDAVVRRAASAVAGRIRATCHHRRCRAPSTGALTARLAPAVADAYDTPAAAARGYRGAVVTIVVRRWTR